MNKKIISIIMLILSVISLFAYKYRLDDGFRIKHNKILYFADSNPYYKSQREKWLFDSFLKEKAIPDYKNWDVILKIQVSNKYDLINPIRISFEDYLNNSFKASFHNSLIEKNLNLLKEKERESTGGLIPDIQLDNFAIPKPIQVVTGKAASKIRIDGSQKITISGKYQEKVNQHIDDNDYGRVKFDPKMEQELKLGLHGTIGDKIFVDINHHSNLDEQIFDPNNIGLRYEGYEDEIIKKIEAGNISLSLSGSRYLSVSGSSQGLFGVKTEMQFGDLSIITIASKEEGKRTTAKYDGNTQNDSTVIWSKDFSKLKHYYILNPYNLFITRQNQEDPAGWNGNAIELDEYGNWLMDSAAADFMPQEGTVQVYVDDNLATNNNIAIEGYEIGEDQLYHFDELIEGTDYLVNYSNGLITFNNRVATKVTIGITYTQQNGIVVGSNSGTLNVKIIKRQYQNNSDDTWNLEARNIYSLGMRNVKNEGFNINIYNLEAGSSAINYTVPDSVDTGNNGQMEFLEYLRLDFDNSGNINGDDPAIDLTNGLVVFPFLRPFSPLGESVIYEEETVNVTDDDIDMKISVKGKIGRESINLGQLNILEDSEEVKVNGEKMKKGEDYIVDYSMGSITMLSARAKNPDAKIEIDYEYLPFFAIESKSLFGTRADWNITDRINLGSTIIYETENVADRNPKIGNENRTLFLADIDGEFEIEVPFITKAIDFLPFLKTDAKSSLNLNGEIALSVPRYFGHSEQNDIGEIYFDDMESILTSYPLNVTRKSWVSASRPYNNFAGRSRIHWWNNNDFYAQDIYDDDTLGEEEKKERINVMTCKIVPPVVDPGSTNKPWSGLMRFMGDQVNLSKKKYIEILAKVVPENNNENIVTMHVDLGTVSEDFYTDFGGMGILNSEDGLFQEFGGEFDGIVTSIEDVGLDMVPDGEPGDDPNDESDNEETNNEKLQINGTENNGYLDTEDLNENGSLDTNNSYFEFSFQMHSMSPHIVSNHDGWILYRIPIDDIDSSQIIHDTSTGLPNMEKLSFAKIWFEPEQTEYPTKIHFANIEVVGNKWEIGSIKDLEDRIISEDELEINNENSQIGISDNKRDMHYKPPSGTTYETDGQKSKEQSLFLSVDNLQPEHQVEIGQEFADKINLLNYGKMKYFIYLEKGEFENDTFADELSAVIKIGADSTIYYEIEKPIMPNEWETKMKEDWWLDFEIDFSDLTSLKEISFDDSASYTDTDTGVKYSIFKNPNLDIIEEISLGIRNNSSSAFSGTIYFDDIRVKDPYDKIGTAARVTLNSRFADFSTLDVTLENKSDNFMSNNRRSRNSSTDTNKEAIQDLTINNKYYLDKFFPEPWNFDVPLTLSGSQSKGVPRFKANSDILVEDLSPAERDRQKTYSLNKTVSLSLSKGGKTDNWFVKYFINNTRLSGSFKDNKSLTATSADTTQTINSRYTYGLTIPKEKISFELFNYRIFYFPSSFDNTLNFGAKYPKRWRWQESTTEESYWKRTENVVDEMTFKSETSVDLDLTSDITSSFSLNTDRDLMQTRFYEKVNIGQETGRDQTINLSYKPKYLQNYFTYNVSTNIGYHENRRKKNTSADAEEDYYYGGDVARGISGTFNLKNSDIFTKIAQYFDAGVEVKKGREETPEIDMGKYQDPKKPEDDKPDEKPEDKPNSDPNWQNQDDELIRIKKEKLQKEKLEKERIEKEKLEKEKAEKLDNEKLDEEQMEKSKADEETKEKDSNEKEKPEINKSASFYFARTFSLLARLDNISIGVSNDYSTSYQQLAKPPEFLYQLSVPNILTDDEIQMKRKSEGFNANSGLLILKNLSTTWKINYGKSQVFTGARTESQDITFPDISMNLTNVQDYFTSIINFVGIDYNFGELLTSSSISSSFSRKITQDGKLNFINPKTETIRNSFSPLIGWTGNWSFDLQSSLRYSISQSETITHREDYDNIARSLGNSLSGSFSYSFDISKGVHIPYIDKTIKLKNQMSTNLNYSYSYDVSKIQGKDDTQTNKDEMKFSISPGLSYKFHKNINGGLNISYDWINNIEREEEIKTFDLGFWVEISF